MGFFEDTRRTHAQRLMATGLVGQATIESLRETGLSLDEHPQVEFRLLVAVEDRPPYAVTHRQIVSRPVLANLRPGVSIPVRVDPADPDSVLIG